MKKIISKLLSFTLLFGCNVTNNMNVYATVAEDVVDDSIEDVNDEITRTETWITDLGVTEDRYTDIYKNKPEKSTDTIIEDCVLCELNIYKSAKMELIVKLDRDTELWIEYSNCKADSNTGILHRMDKGYAPIHTIMYIPYYKYFVNYGTESYYKYWNDEHYNLLPRDFACLETHLSNFVEDNVEFLRYSGGFGNDTQYAFFGPNEIKYTFVPTRTLKDTEYEFRLFGHKFTYNPNNSNNNIEPTNEPETDTDYIDRIKSLEEENAKLKEQNEALKSTLASYGNRAYGDMNDDGCVDGRDASLLLTYYAKTSVGYTGTLDNFIQEQNKVEN